MTTSHQPWLLARRTEHPAGQHIPSERRHIGATERDSNARPELPRRIQIADYERLTPGVLQCTPGTQMLQFCVSHHRAGALIAA
jgi:hypothetical protein